MLEYKVTKKANKKIILRQYLITGYRCALLQLMLRSVRRVISAV